MACPRVAYRRKTHYATRSNRVKFVRTPGNKLVLQKRQKRGGGAFTPWVLGHKRIGGTKRLTHSELKKGSLRTSKTVSRPYGGVLSHDQVRDRIVRAFLLEEQRIVRKVVEAEGKFQRDKKRRDQKKKKRAAKEKAAAKKVGARRTTTKTDKKKAKTVATKSAPVGAKVAAAPTKTKKK